ncbi:hypothetical protein VUR80DRAFT_7724 [Thermomyces stellatus]
MDPKKDKTFELTEETTHVCSAGSPTRRNHAFSPTDSSMNTKDLEARKAASRIYKGASGDGKNRKTAWDHIFCIQSRGSAVTKAEATE